MLRLKSARRSFKILVLNTFSDSRFPVPPSSPKPPSFDWRRLTWISLLVYNPTTSARGRQGSSEDENVRIGENKIENHVVPVVCTSAADIELPNRKHPYPHSIGNNQYVFFIKHDLSTTLHGYKTIWAV